MQEELSVIVSDYPLMKLLAFQRLFNKGSIADTLTVSDICCEPLNRVRTKRKGRFRLDHIILESVKFQVSELVIKLDDAIDDFQSESGIEELMQAPLHGVTFRHRLRDLRSEGI